MVSDKVGISGSSHLLPTCSHHLPRSETYFTQLAHFLTPKNLERDEQEEVLSPPLLSSHLSCIKYR